MNGIILKSKMFLSRENMHLERQRIIRELREGITLVDPSIEVMAVPGEWISSKIIEPRMFEDILFCDKNGIEYVGTFDRLSRYLTYSGDAIENVVAWMPAPAPYEAKA